MGRDRKPLVSVIMPCYNHEKYVAQSIESVLNQTYDNIEFVVLDNGSTDGSYDVIKGYSDRISKLLHVDENNVLEAGKRLLAECTGEYIALMTSDDVWEPDKIEKQVAAILSHENIQACFTWVCILGEDGSKRENAAINIFMQDNRTRYEWLERLLMEGNCLCFPSAVIKRETCQYIFYHVSPLRQIQDLEMWVQLLLQGGDIYVVQEPLVNFRWHPAGPNQNTSAQTVENRIRGLNENIYFTSYYICKMDSQIFINTFRKHLKNQNVSNESAVQCEKFLFLKTLAESKYEFQQMAMLFYYQMDVEALKCLNEQYGVTFDDFCQYSGTSGIGALDQTIYEIDTNLTFVKQHRKLLSELYQSNRDDFRTATYRYRLYTGSIFTELQREYCAYVVDFNEWLMQYLEHTNDEQLLCDYGQIFSQLQSLKKALDALWDDFLTFDPEMSHEEYQRFQQGMSGCAEDLDVFSNEVLPFVLHSYVVLKEYKG